MAAANAPASPGGTWSPDSPSTTMSARPPAFETTMGLPHIIASTATWPNGSAHTDGTVAISQWHHAAITSAWATLWTTVTDGESTTRRAGLRSADEHERHLVTEQAVRFDQHVDPLVHPEGSDEQHVVVVGRQERRASAGAADALDVVRHE